MLFMSKVHASLWRLMIAFALGRDIGAESQCKIETTRSPRQSRTEMPEVGALLQIWAFCCSRFSLTERSRRSMRWWYRGSWCRNKGVYRALPGIHLQRKAKKLSNQCLPTWQAAAMEGWSMWYAIWAMISTGAVLAAVEDGCRLAE
ncbi:MAG: hypothetical protein BYD32DRAFT_422443 [Podila humilis]|nr:MAG: hypothetical protein BYD32DRAFT_422443 [Podila humilis]